MYCAECVFTWRVLDHKATEEVLGHFFFFCQAAMVADRNEHLVFFVELPDSTQVAAELVLLLVKLVLVHTAVPACKHETSRLQRNHRNVLTDLANLLFSDKQEGTWGNSGGFVKILQRDIFVCYGYSRVVTLHMYNRGLYLESIMRTMSWSLYRDEFSLTSCLNMLQLFVKVTLENR